MNPLTETWQIHNRINLYLLDGIGEIYLGDMSASKGRTVGEQFAHMHNVRLMWLKVSEPALLDGLEKLEKGQITKKGLDDALTGSGIALQQFFEKVTPEAKVKGFKPHATAFLGYLISHESHHRGQIMLTLKQSGHPVDKKIQFGIWEWGAR
ncbi:MAG: DinB family protein [Mucilaginibacter sp.]